MQGGGNILILKYETHIFFSCYWLAGSPQDRFWVTYYEDNMFTFLLGSYHSLFVNLIFVIHTLKVQMYKIFIVCFESFFLHHSIINRCQTKYSHHFRKSFSNSPRYSKFSIIPCFHRKRRTQLSAKMKFHILGKFAE
jgi:hypothetical protein